MPQIKVSGLDQGRKYYVRARVQNSSLNLSDWSLPLTFTTAEDKIPPGAIEDLLFESEGDSFIARWNPPTANEDGSLMTDLAHYRVQVTSLKDAQVRTFTTKDQIVTIDLNRNKNLFGSLVGHLKIAIAAVDLSGNIGESVSAEAQNSPPGRVENVTAEGSVQTIHVGWDKVDENDLDHYLVYVSGIGPGFQPGPDTYLTKTTALEYVMVTKNPDVQYFRVVAVDKFGQASEPSLAAWDYARQSFGTDVEPPSDIKNFNVSLELSTDQSSAEAHVSFDPVLSSDVDKYEVAYKTTSATVWSYITLPSDEVTATIGGLKIGTDYQFKARVIDYYANASNWTTIISRSGVIKTTAPPKTLGVDALGGRNNMIVRWDASTDESMANGEGQYEVEYSLSPSFSGSTTVKVSGTVASILNLGEKKTYYVRVRAIDSFGNIGAWSDTDTADTGEVVHDDSITGIKIAGESITGDHIQTNTIDAASLKAGTAFVGDLNVKSTLTVGTNGVIKSENYGPDTAGYYLDKQQLIINDGSISAAALNIQDSHNMIHAAYSAFMFGGAFYLNEQNVQRENGAIVEPLEGQGRAGSGALKHSSGGVLNLQPISDFSDGTPLILEAGEKYIVSAYVKKGSATDVSASIGMAYSGLDGLEYGENTGESVLITNQNEWTRIQTVIDTELASDSSAVVRLHHYGPTAGILLWSHLQVERMIGKKESASPWTPPGFTRISGESIATGSIQSSSVANYGGIIQPAWSLNTKGDLTIGSGYVRGHLIVGGKEDGTGSPEVAIQSKDYLEMTRGWAIKSDGDVEFNNGTFRGTLSLEKAGLNDIDLSMTASVSEVKLYVNETDSRPINAASIQGVTYAFDRQEVEDSGVFLPTIPDEEKIGRYYIGPTTDRSVNIQVHEGPEENAVYLDRPPVDVALTSLRVGEITTPSSEPMSREKQGVSFDAIRVEEDPDDPNLQSTTAVSQTSTVQLRSPYYPEEDRDGEYPESRHVLESVVDFTAPSSKNLIDPIYSLPADAAPGMTARRGRSDYDGRAYLLLGSGSSAMPHYFALAESISAGKKYILSIYVDTLDATGDTTFYGMFHPQGGTVKYMTPLGDHRISSNNPGIVIEAGQESVRIAHSFTAAAQDNSVGMSVHGTAGGTVYGFKVQLEEASYQSNMSFPEEIRNKTAPTPWTINGAKSSSSASLTLKAEPAPDYNSWASSSIVGYQAHTPGAQEVGKRDLPASMELNLSSAYTYSGGGSGRSSADATYKWGTAGMVYPGAKSAFLPAAADIYWDFQQSSPLEKPTLGDGTGIRTINDGPWGAINLQGGVYIEDYFNGSSFGNAWGHHGVHGITISGSPFRNRAYSTFQVRRPEAFVYHLTPLGTVDRQVISYSTRNYRYGVFNSSWNAPNTSAIISYNPNTGEGIFLYLGSKGSDQTWTLYSYKNYTETVLLSGTYSYNWSNNSWRNMTFERIGNRLKCTYVDNVLFDHAFNESQLTDGKHVGFHIDSGRVDTFRAYDNIPSSNAYGRLESQSFNINNNRGIDVAANGTVKIASPGFYMMTADITAAFNARANESYWIYVDEVIPGLGTTVHSLSGSPGWGALNITGTAVAYLQGELFLRVRTNAQDRRTLDRVNWTIVRVA